MVTATTVTAFIAGAAIVGLLFGGAAWHRRTRRQRRVRDRLRQFCGTYVGSMTPLIRRANTDRSLGRAA